MSPREADLYRLLYERRSDPVSPTISEMCEALGINSRSALHRWLSNIEELGFIAIERRGHGKRNVVRLTQKRPAGFALPDEVLWWCIETKRSDKLPGRVFQPLTLSFSRSHPPRLALDLLARPSREARWARVRVQIEEVTSA
jgi:hypothetical protein